MRGAASRAGGLDHAAGGVREAQQGRVGSLVQSSLGDVRASASTCLLPNTAAHSRLRIVGGYVLLC